MNPESKQKPFHEVARHGHIIEQARSRFKTRSRDRIKAKLAAAESIDGEVLGKDSITNISHNTSSNDSLKTKSQAPSSSFSSEPIISSELSNVEKYLNIKALKETSSSSEEFKKSQPDRKKQMLAVLFGSSPSKKASTHNKSPNRHSSQSNDPISQDNIDEPNLSNEAICKPLKPAPPKRRRISKTIITPDVILTKKKLYKTLDERQLNLLGSMFSSPSSPNPLKGRRKSHNIVRSSDFHKDKNSSSDSIQSKDDKDIVLHSISPSSDHQQANAEHSTKVNNFLSENKSLTTSKFISPTIQHSTTVTDHKPKEQSKSISSKSKDSKIQQSTTVTDNLPEEKSLFVKRTLPRRSKRISPKPNIHSKPNESENQLSNVPEQKSPQKIPLKERVASIRAKQRAYKSLDDRQRKLIGMMFSSSKQKKPTPSPNSNEDKLSSENIKEQIISKTTAKLRESVTRITNAKKSTINIIEKTEEPQSEPPPSRHDSNISEHHLHLPRHQIDIECSIPSTSNKPIKPPPPPRENMVKLAAEKFRANVANKMRSRKSINQSQPSEQTVKPNEISTSTTQKMDFSRAAMVAKAVNRFKAKAKKKIPSTPTPSNSLNQKIEIKASPAVLHQVEKKEKKPLSLQGAAKVASIVSRLKKKTAERFKAKSIAMSTETSKNIIEPSSLNEKVHLDSSHSEIPKEEKGDNYILTNELDQILSSPVYRFALRQFFTELNEVEIMDIIETIELFESNPSHAIGNFIYLRYIVDSKLPSALPQEIKDGFSKEEYQTFNKSDFSHFKKYLHFLLQRYYIQRFINTRQYKQLAAKSQNVHTDLNTEPELHDILEDDKNRSLFANFLDYNMCSENLKFLDAIDELKKTKSEELHHVYQDIYYKFIDANSEFAINIDHDSQQILRSQILEEEIYSPEIFENSIFIVRDMLENDVLPRFFSSQEWIKEHPNVSQLLQDIRTEIISSELSYLQSLEDIVNHYKSPLCSSNSPVPNIPKEVLNRMFNHSEELFTLHKRLHASFETNTDISRIFLEFLEEFSLYNSVFRDFSNSVRSFTNFQEYELFQEFLLKKRELTSNRDIMSLLLLPLYRLEIYSTYFSRIVTLISSPTVNQQLNSARVLLNYLEYFVHENLSKNSGWIQMAKVLEVQHLLKNNNIALVKIGRKLLHQCQVIEAKKQILRGTSCKPRIIFLFNDLLIWSGERYQVRGNFVLSEILHVKPIIFKDLSLEYGIEIYSSNPKATKLFFFFSTESERQNVIDLIVNAIQQPETSNIQRRLSSPNIRLDAMQKMHDNHKASFSKKSLLWLNKGKN